MVPVKVKQLNDGTREVVPILEASRDIPMSSRAWTCSKCNAGIPTSDRPRDKRGRSYQEEKSIATHVKQCTPRRKNVRWKQFCENAVTISRNNPGAIRYNTKRQEDARAKFDRMLVPAGHKIVHLGSCTLGSVKKQIWTCTRCRRNPVDLCIEQQQRGNIGKCLQYDPVTAANTKRRPSETLWKALGAAGGMQETFAKATSMTSAELQARAGKPGKA